MAVLGHRGRRLSIALLLIMIFTLYFLLSTTSPMTPLSCRSIRARLHFNKQGLGRKEVRGFLRSKASITDLNDYRAAAPAEARQEHVLVLSVQTEPRIAPDLNKVLAQLDATDYPNHLITVGVLVPSTVDAEIILSPPLHPAFADVVIIQRDFDFSTNSSGASEIMDDMTLSRARNFLLAAALKEHHSWVTWIDMNVEFPPTIFQDLMRFDADIIVPNCLLKRGHPDDFWGHDRHNWQESDQSLEAQRHVGEEYIFPAGLERSLLIDMPTHLGKHYKVNLDAVGTTFTLVKAHVHRQGVNFPAFNYRHHTGSEAFGKIANVMGFTVFGVPGYRVYYVPPQRPLINPQSAEI